MIFDRIENVNNYKGLGRVYTALKFMAKTDFTQIPIGKYELDDNIYYMVQQYDTNPDKTVACATHGGVTRCLLCRLLYGEIECLKDTGWTDNTAVTLLEFDEELNPRIVFANDASHVPVAFMPKRSKIASYAKEENK